MAYGYRSGGGLATHSSSMSRLCMTWMYELDMGPACCCGHGDFLTLTFGGDVIYHHRTVHGPLLEKDIPSRSPRALSTSKQDAVNSREMQAGHQEQYSSYEIFQAEGHDMVHSSHGISLAEITHKLSMRLQPCTGRRQARRATMVSPALIPRSTVIPLHLKPSH